MKVEKLNISEDLVLAINETGRRILVFVEGDDDKDYFEKLFFNYLSQVYFHSSGGCHHVIKNLTDILQIASNKNNKYGIIDRDYRLETERQIDIEANVNLKILIYCNIETYLSLSGSIETKQKLRHGANSPKIGAFSTLEKTKNISLDIAQKLFPISIGDWIIKDLNKSIKEGLPKVGFLPNGFPEDPNVIQKYIAKEFDKDIAEIKELYLLKEKEIKSEIKNIDDFLKYVKGERILHYLCHEHELGSVEECFRFLIYDADKKVCHPHLKDLILIEILKNKVSELF